MQDRAEGPWVKFSVHPRQRNTSHLVICQAPVHDRRIVRDSGGHEEERYVIQTNIRLAGVDHRIELTLTDRDNMGFRMLLGRTAIRGCYLVDPGSSYLTKDKT